MTTPKPTNRECGDGHHKTCPGIVYIIPGGYVLCQCSCHDKKGKSA